MLSLFKPKRLLSALILSGMTAALQAAPGRTGSEYRIMPALPGDQIQVQLAFNESGGFLVTQDNSIDGDGLGIRARRFHADLSAAPSSFRVNAQGLADQKNARVALLQGGGAVFAWESSTGSGHRIMLRFLDANDVLNAGDIQASRFVIGSQSAPALATLADGNVVVVWAELDRDGDMDGIFGQIYTPGGARVGNTFQINEHTAVSQRTPVVAALSDGKFVVAWISDENRHGESIDLYGRLFAADGAPAGGEFPLNAWNTQVVNGQSREVREVCANPYLASTPGGFRAAWSERMSDLRVEGWDVVTRSFNLQGAALGGEEVVNTTRQGDQFSPKIAVSGGTQLIVWTSFGQDGADEGIFGRFLEVNGEWSDEFLVNTRTITKQLYPAVTGVGPGDFVVAWSSFMGGIESYDLFAQNYSSGGSGNLAQMSAPFVSSLSQNSIMATWNVFPEGVGSYLVYVDDEQVPTETSQGYLTVTRPAWQPASTHTVRLAYKTEGGAVSPLSDPVTVQTWGPDQNNDGLPDDWQQINFGKLRPSGKEDTDQDGASNLAEFMAGTDPTDPASVLQTRVVGREQGLYIEWNTVPGSYYQLQVTSDFENWTSVGTPRFAHSAFDALPCTGPGQVRYYRVIRMR